MGNRSSGEKSIGWKLGVPGLGSEKEQEAKRQRKDEAERLMSHLSGKDREPLAASVADSG